MFSLIIAIIAIAMVAGLAVSSLMLVTDKMPQNHTPRAEVISQQNKSLNEKPTSVISHIKEDVKKSEPIIQRTEVSTVNNYDFKALSETLKMIFFAVGGALGLKYGFRGVKYVFRRIKFMIYEKKSEYMIINLSKNLNNKSYILNFTEVVERQLLKNKLLLAHSNNEELSIDLKVIDEELKNKFDFVSNKLIMDMR